MKSILTLLTTIILLFSLSGCATSSKEAKQLLSKNGISEIEVCRANGMVNTMAYKEGMMVTDHNACDPFYTISEEDVKQYIAAKDRAAKAKADRVKEEAENARVAKFLAEAQEAKEKEDRKDKIEADRKDKIEADKNTKARKDQVIARMKTLGVSEGEIRKAFSSSVYWYKNSDGGDEPLHLYEEDAITDKHIDGYLKEKAEQKEKKSKEAEYERNAKIHVGKQYICTDGYDSWVLKYNSDGFTFGGVNYSNHLLGYTSTKSLMSSPRIDRAKGTVTHNGNKSTCKPR